MAKNEAKVNVRLLINGTVSEIRPDVDKKKLKIRGPKEIGQMRFREDVIANLIHKKDVNERISNAITLIHTGTLPEIKSLEKELKKAKSDLKSEKELVKELQKASKEGGKKEKDTTEK